MKTIVSLVICLIIVCSCNANTKCDLGYLLKNSDDTATLKTVAMDDDCLGGLMDSMANETLLENCDHNAIYSLLTNLYKYADGGPAEVISYGSYRIFLQNPVPFIKYLSNNKTSSLTTVILNELCMNVGLEVKFKTKQSVIDYLLQCIEQWESGRTFIDGFIKEYEGVDCN